MSDSKQRLLFSILLIGAGIGLLSPRFALAQTPEQEGELTASVGRPTASVDGPVLILELMDSTLITRAWESLFPDSTAPAGEYQILIPSGPVLSSGQELSPTVFLLRNGAEVGRMDRATWETLAAASESEADPGWAAAMEGPEKQQVPLLWHAVQWNRETLLEWAEWPAEFEVGIGSSASAIRSYKPQFQRDIDFAWDQKLFRHFLLGAELHRSQFGGGLSRLGWTVADTAGGRPASREDPDFWGDAYWWWGVSAGVPGIKYTLTLADQPLPLYYWLEPSSATAIRNHASGRLVKQWKGESLEREGNLSHTLDARLGFLRYGLHWDMDAYRVPVQVLGLDDLPALFGTWGGGLIVASDILATRVWVDIPDLTLKLGVPESYPTRFRVAFLHLEMSYRNLRSFSLGLSVRVKVSNPIMNAPGA